MRGLEVPETSICIKEVAQLMTLISGWPGADSMGRILHKGTKHVHQANKSLSAVSRRCALRFLALVKNSAVGAYVQAPLYRTSPNMAARCISTTSTEVVKRSKVKAQSQKQYTVLHDINAYHAMQTPAFTCSSRQIMAYVIAGLIRSFENSALQRLFHPDSFGALLGLSTCKCFCNDLTLLLGDFERALLGEADSLLADAGRPVYMGILGSLS
ncbi:uncharacterized protein MYCFIDRAFT_180571 [Pseudocercospora fijiensis CIRAD86]|uniref:Uncharacterized protein n=1 Tax=Pseudocercospora fijiensis (strain CIRAD86) TaxID=383855 RepID=M3AI78_PSEFD|nr:uncharacterized protein MYCFIDRAFT_180571 [Pseudocercospora fijiensis CIRAD86]EME76913.1 hypothetical protein MYCFIDRAFT_180571 [Pseudocercospora fijiensis CIRAD86]